MDHNILYQTTLDFKDIDKKKKPFENIVGKGENAGKQHFHLFQQCFLPYQRPVKTFHLILFCRLQMLSV